MADAHSEDALFFPGASGKAVFGVRHNTTPDAEAVVVFCNPFGEEKQNCYRPFVCFGRYLAASGIPSIRFDVTGTGDSDGDSSEMTLETQLLDLRAAMNLAKESFSVDSVSLVGLRLGGAVAALAAERWDDVRSLTLLSPITDGTAYWNELLRKEQFAAIAMGNKARKKSDLLAELDANGSVEIEAQILCVEFVEQLSKLKLCESVANFCGNVLATGISSAESTHGQFLELLSRYEAHGSRVENWFDEERDYWSARSMYDAYVPEETFSRVAGWIGQ